MVHSEAVSLLGTDLTSHFYGGRLCLGLVNTVFWRRSADPEDQLSSYVDLVEFVGRSGWLPAQEKLMALADAHPTRASRALAGALQLREQLHSVFASVAAELDPDDTSLESVQEVGARGLAKLRLVRDGSGYRMHWSEPSFELPAEEAAVSALQLLTSPERDRVKQCPGPTCGWVFLDTTRNRSRRWCEPSECGNRSRVQAHYRRTRGA